MVRIRPALVVLAAAAMVAPPVFAGEAPPSVEARAAAEADGMLLAQARYCGAPQDVGAALMAALQRRAQAATPTGARSFDTVAYQRVVMEGFERMAGTLRSIDAQWESESTSPSPQRVQQYVEECTQVQREVDALLTAADDAGPSAMPSSSLP